MMKKTIFGIPAILRNAMDYPLRQVFRGRRSGQIIQNEPKDGLYNHLPEGDREEIEGTAARLMMEYHLHHFYAHSTADNYRENLYYLALLERALNEASLTLPSSIAAADIGSSHWFYVQVYYELLKWWGCPNGREVTLKGYEVDAYQLYTDFHSRYDHAKAHIRELEGVHFLPQSFDKKAASFDMVIMLFPFIFLEDHLNWGIPFPSFKPEKLLVSAWESVKPGGALIIANQGKEEHQAQLDMLRSENLETVVSFRFESLLYQYDLPRYVVVLCRHG